jgi:hypothetical protein
MITSNFVLLRNKIIRKINKNIYIIKDPYEIKNMKYHLMLCININIIHFNME